MISTCSKPRDTNRGRGGTQVRFHFAHAHNFKYSRVTIMVVLKNIPRILSPQLLSVLARMGHGDEIGK